MEWVGVAPVGKATKQQVPHSRCVWPGANATSPPRQLSASPHPAEAQPPRLSWQADLPGGLPGHRCSGTGGSKVRPDSSWGLRAWGGASLGSLQPLSHVSLAGPSSNRSAHLGLGFRLDPERGHGRGGGSSVARGPRSGHPEGKVKAALTPRSSCVAGSGDTGGGGHRAERERGGGPQPKRCSP